MPPASPAAPTELERQYATATTAYLRLRRRGIAPPHEEWLRQQHPELRDALRQFLANLHPAEAPSAVRPATIPASWRTSLTQYEPVLEKNAPVEFGRGGIGRVMKYRDRLFRREVAIKFLLDEHHGSPEWEERFCAEGAHQAAVQHAGVPAVYAFGWDEMAGPFLVMQPIGGRNGKQWIDEHAKPGRAGGNEARLLSVFQQVVGTVAHAHRRALVHLDLKPDNLVVSDTGGAWVLDWGIARGMEPPGAATASPVRSSSRSGTPAYQAPEQKEPGKYPQADPKRTDVFLLGGLLCHLLTGQPPRATTTGDLAAARVRLQDHTASPKLNRIALTCLTENPAGRYADATEVEAALATYQAEVLQRDKKRGEAITWGRAWKRASVVIGIVALVATLGWIRADRAVRDRDVALVGERKARVEADRQRGVAETALAAEQQARFELDGEFRAKVAALEESDRQRVEKETALGVAVTRLAKLEQLYDIFGQVLGGLNPQSPGEKGKPLAVLLGERLERANADLDRLAIDDPLILAKFRVAVGSALLGVGSHDRALHQFAAAHDIRKARLGPDHPDTLHARSGMASAHEAAGNVVVAVSMVEEVFERRRATLGSDHAATLNSQYNLASGYLGLGKYGQAMKTLEDVYQRQCKHPDFGRDHPETLVTRAQLGSAYLADGQVRRAIETLEEVYRKQGTHADQRKEYSRTQTTAHHLGWAYYRDNRLAEAQALLKATYHARLLTLGLNHPESLKTAVTLATVCSRLQKHEEAIQLLRDALAVQTRTLGPRHPNTLVTRHNLGIALSDDGKGEEAIGLLEATWQDRAARDGHDHPLTLHTANNLGLAYLRFGYPEQAIRILDDALRRRARSATLKPDHPDTLTNLGLLGASYRAARRFDQAIPLLERAFALRAAHAETGSDWAAAFGVAQQLAWAYRDGGRAEEAARTLEGLLCGVTPHLGGERHPAVLDTRRDLAFAYLDAGRPADARQVLGGYIGSVREALKADPHTVAHRLGDTGREWLDRRHASEAEPLFREALAIRKTTNPDQWMTFATQSLLGRCLVELGRYAEAEALLVDAYKELQRRAATIPPAGRHFAADTADGLLRLYAAVGKPDKVAIWQVERAKHPREQLPFPQPTK